MSTTPVDRRARNIIGSNIRPGRMPGGFSHYISQHVHGARKKRTTMEDVKAAANDALARRGLQNAPDAFIGTQALPAKPVVEQS